MILLGVSLVAGLLLMVLVGRVVKMWREARKVKKDMGRLKAGSVWRLRSHIYRNDPFAKNAEYRVTVQETKVNRDERMWVKYLHEWGLVETNPADVFVHLYLYAEDQDLGIKGDEVQRSARLMRRREEKGERREEKGERRK